MPLVFQYGSNCTAARLNGPNRLKGNAQVVGPARTVGQYDIAFDVWSDGNGCAAADLRRRKSRYAWGVLYDIPADWIFGQRSDKCRALEQIEGNRYEPKRIRVRTITGKQILAITFLVRRRSRQRGIATSADYVGHIVRGLRAHGVEEEYVQHVIDVAIDTTRRAGKKAKEKIREIELLREPGHC